MSLSFKRSVLKLLDDVTAAGAGSWVNLDNTYNNLYSAVAATSVESTDWITLQGRLERSDDALVINIASVSASGATLIDRPYNQIRAFKTGTAGKAKVTLFG